MTRRRVAFGAFLALATVAAWLATARLAPLPRVYVALLLVPLPALMWWQGSFAEEAMETATRGALYLSSAVTLWVLAGATAVVAWRGGLPAAAVGLTMPRPLPLVGWAAAGWAAGVAVLVLGKALRLHETPILRFLIPRTSGERGGFAALSLTAGVAEEFVFRGFLLLALSRATGSLALAVGASSIVFGVMHAYQSASGAARAAVLGALLAAPVLATGSVVPSMIAHAAIDMTSGLWLAPWLLRR